MDKKVRKRIIFYGSVQGVGFRWRAVNAANSVGATGLVRNEYDGSVYMEIQGTEEQIDRVIMMIEKSRYISIDSMSVRTIPTDEGERQFRVD